jgi:hypothetical protein
MKLKGRRVILDYFNPVEQGHDIISVKYANLAHPDLLSAMDRLVPHFTLLCELPESEKLRSMLAPGGTAVEDINSDDFPKVQVTGFSIGGNEDDVSLVIIGGRLLNNGKQININSPCVRYDEEEYEYAGELSLAIQEVEDEIRQFLGGKIYHKQLDIFDDSNANASRKNESK